MIEGLFTYTAGSDEQQFNDPNRADKLPSNTVKFTLYGFKQPES